MAYKTDIEIAQEATLLPINQVAASLGIPDEAVENYGRYKAKLDIHALKDLPEKGKLILVTAITPTPAGEGKTTTSVGLTDGLRKIGKNAVVALREPSLGPVFGVKGGAAGGGYAQVVPMEDINLHFTGDFHAIGAANNLLAAMLDNHIQQGNTLGIDPKAITWKRAVDMNDRQFIHGGPFANIAHGCNSVTATHTALKLADYVVTEAGFAADLGAEKFVDIKCRMADLHPSAVVIVATVRALKYHGGVPKAELNQENLEALELGLPNLLQHVSNVKNVFGLPCVVAINAFPTDTKAELDLVEKRCNELGVNVALSEVWAKGGEGGKALAEEVVRLCDQPNNFSFTYELDKSIEEKIHDIAHRIYHAKHLMMLPAAKKKAAELEKLGFGNLPICMAKTQYSFSDDPTLLGAPQDFTVTVSNVKVCAGAGFIVAYTGDIMTMPGLPKVPAAEKIDVDENGRISGLF